MKSITSSFERLVIGRYSKDKKVEFKEKRQRVNISVEKDDLVHHVYQLAGKQFGEHLPERHHECEVDWQQPIPCVISSVSFHSRKPNCEKFDFL